MSSNTIFSTTVVLIITTISRAQRLMNILSRPAASFIRARSKQCRSKISPSFRPRYTPRISLNYHHVTVATANFDKHALEYFTYTPARYTYKLNAGDFLHDPETRTEHSSIKIFVSLCIWKSKVARTAEPRLYLWKSPSGISDISSAIRDH